ncbi:MAG: FAD-dependent oxidoreductase [Gammaproteobacteria bacterium]|nr:FAD-dependent oxidoreductase [Gammaproteobacteria bacterium]
MKQIAVIGSGISGLTSAYLLSQDHHVCLYEANPVLGGHTATVDVTVNEKDYAIDTGFIVFNDWTYPNFLKLLDKTGIDKQETEMSFSVQHLQSGIEYNGHSLSTMFAQRKNLVSPRFYKFIYDIVRFNKASKQLLKEQSAQSDLTLGDFLDQHRFSDFFAEHYILPMVAAIWSASIDDAREFPLGLFLRFFKNHGLLNIVDRPQWYVIKGGSRSYIPALTAAVQEIKLDCAVSAVERNAEGVEVHSADGSRTFDEVILACHSDQSLRLLKDISDDEQQVLSGIKYRENEVVLHTDRNLLPDQPKAWASWNFWQGQSHDSAPAVTYNMNILQGLAADETFCVTLNRSSAIDPDQVLGEFRYAHPVYEPGTVTAQQNRDLICGKNHTHFCGAYWYNGFHEDGVKSALDVCARFGVSL